MGNIFRSYREDPLIDEGTDQSEPNVSDGGIDIPDIIGSYGPWQRKIFLLAFFASFPNSWNALVMSLFAPNVEHWCRRPNLYNNFSNAEWKNYAIPLIDDGSRFSRCKMYDLETVGYLQPPDHNLTIACAAWEYDHSQYRATIVEKWNLVCSKEWLVSLSQSIYMAGFLVAVFVFGQLADRFGRRPIILVCITLNIVAGLLTSFSTNYVMFTILRFIVALGVAGSWTTSFVLVMEVVGAKQRPVLGVAIQLGWATAYVVLGAIGWLLKDWFYIQLSISIPSIAMALSWWILPESPRLLLTLGRLKEAEEVLQKAMKENGRNICDLKTVIKQIKEQIDNEKTKRVNKTALDLLKTPNMRNKTLNIYFCWFVNAFVYFGLSLNTNNLGGNPYVNFLISGAVELPSCFVTIFILNYFGRKKPTTFAMLVGGLGCLLTIPIPEGLTWLRITLAMLGKACITASFAIIYVFSAEIFPTVVRNVGVGSSSTCARIGSMIAPFVKEVGTATNTGVPLGIFGGLSVLSGLLVLLLPETSNSPIPDTLEEGENFGKSGNHRSINPRGTQNQHHVENYSTQPENSLTDSSVFN